jgi:hypothetical protein
VTAARRRFTVASVFGFRVALGLPVTVTKPGFWMSEVTKLLPGASPVLQPGLARVSPAWRGQPVLGVAAGRRCPRQPGRAGKPGVSPLNI